VLLYVDLAKARKRMDPGPGQLSLFGGGAPGQPPKPTQAATEGKHQEMVHVAAHLRHTEHGSVQVPAHTRLVMVASPRPDPEHVAKAKAAYERMADLDDAEASHAEVGRGVNHPARVAVRKQHDEAAAEFHSYPQHVQDAAVKVSADEVEAKAAAGQAEREKKEAAEREAHYAKIRQQEVARRDEIARQRETEAKAAPPSAEDPKLGARILDAFQQLRDPKGLNLVSMGDLWRRLDVPLRDLHNEIRNLQKEGKIVLHTHDGRHGKLSEKDKDASFFDKNDRLLSYVSVREPAEEEPAAAPKAEPAQGSTETARAQQAETDAKSATRPATGSGIPTTTRDDDRALAKMSPARRRDLQLALARHHVEPGHVAEIDAAASKLRTDKKATNWMDAYHEAAAPFLRADPRDLSKETEQELDHFSTLKRTHPALHLAASHEIDRRAREHQKKMKGWDEGQVGAVTRYADGSAPSAAYTDAAEKHFSKLWGDLPRDRFNQPKLTDSVKRALELEAHDRGYTHAAGEGMAMHRRPDAPARLDPYTGPKSEREKVIDEIRAHNAEMDRRAAGEKFAVKRAKYERAKIDESTFGEKSRRGHTDLRDMLDDAKREVDEG
jgi:hypothetical protein